MRRVMINNQFVAFYQTVIQTTQTLMLQKWATLACLVFIRKLTEFQRVSTCVNTFCMSIFQIRLKSRILN